MHKRKAASVFSGDPLDDEDVDDDWDGGGEGSSAMQNEDDDLLAQHLSDALVDATGALKSCSCHAANQHPAHQRHQHQCVLPTSPEFNSNRRNVDSSDKTKLWITHSLRSAIERGKVATNVVLGFDNDSKALEIAAEVRQRLLDLFLLFGEIVDFYQPIGASFCYLQYLNPDIAVATQKEFAALLTSRTSSTNSRSSSQSVATKESSTSLSTTHLLNEWRGRLTQLLGKKTIGETNVGIDHLMETLDNLISVSFTTKRSLAVAKRRKRNGPSDPASSTTTLSTSPSAAFSTSPSGFAFSFSPSSNPLASSFVTIAELSHIENLGGDVGCYEAVEGDNE